MQKTYLRQYVNYFKLAQDGCKYYDMTGRHVLSIVEGIIHVKNKNNWSQCKEGDLIVSIVNNIPLHN
mgnify:CR=1 FL=1